MNHEQEPHAKQNRDRLRQKLSLYVVTDDRADVRDQLRVIERALKGGATTIQLRRKDDDGRVLVELGHQIRELTNRYQALYIVNDRVDIALLTDADGVHVGQSDIPCRDVRKLVGDKMIGVSAGTVEEAQTAFWDGADYLGVGAIFPTSSKPDADLCGLSGLKSITSKVEDIPIVAIGGITLTNAARILSAGADGLAVVSAVMSAPHPEEACRDLKRVIHLAVQNRRLPS